VTSLPPMIREEQDHLARTRRLLQEHPEEAARSDDDTIRELMRLREDYLEARLPDDKSAIQQQIDTLTAQLDQQRRARKTEWVDPDSPYFAHLQVEEDGRRREIFLGRATRLENGLRIVDWRDAPVSRLFYQYAEGDEYAEEIAGKVREGVLTARRTLHIEGGALMRVGTARENYVLHGDTWEHFARDAQKLAGGAGSALRAGAVGDARLGAGARLRADKHLPDIAALIDPEQFQLISRENKGVVVLRGSAGSGKTTVALHRIAYLAFQLGSSFDPDRVLVIVWGRAMRDYVAHVLPALGVAGVQVTTWTEWARDMMAKHFSFLPPFIADDTPEPVVRLKLHPRVSDLLARQIAASPVTRAGAAQAVWDWARLLTDRAALAEALGPDMSEEALERALRWTTEQTTAVLKFCEGDHEVDARLDTEDDALLLRAWQLRLGPLQKRPGKPLKHQHIVLDEVQDFSPVEVQVLLDTTDKNRSVTMAGDTRQHISEAAGFTSWMDFLTHIGVESTALSTLEVSYRSTHPITRFAISVLGDENEPPPRTTRDGPPVELFRFTDHGACVAFLAEELRALLRAEPHANVALLTPDNALAELYVRGLRRADVPDVRLVENQKFAFAAGVDVVEASQVKGLEFDYVVIIEASAAFWPDTPHHRRLLHVAATRAVHQLWLTSVGAPSSILPEGTR